MSRARLLRHAVWLHSFRLRYGTHALRWNRFIWLNLRSVLHGNTRPTKVR